MELLQDCNEVYCRLIGRKNCRFMDHWTMQNPAIAAGPATKSGNRKKYGRPGNGGRISLCLR